MHLDPKNHLSGIINCMEILSLLHKTEVMVSKKNPKTIQVTTTDSYSINVPPRYLSPSPIAEEVKAQFEKQFQQFTEKFNIAFNK